MSILSEKIDGKIINIDINSSNLKSGSYNTETQKLTLEFKHGGSYNYFEVPWAIFTALRMSNSQGKYFSANIKNNYKFEKNIPKQKTKEEK